MTILLYHNLIKDKDIDDNLFRRSYEGSPCLYYRSESDFKGDMWRLGGRKVVWVGQGEKDDVGISFDDAKESVYKIAFPILKEYNYKFSVFASTGKIGEKGYCSWEELKEMSKYGKYGDGLARIESHGHTHLPFDSLSEEELKEELELSYKLIKEKIGKAPDYVSCPGSRRIDRKIARGCGYMDIRYNLTGNLGEIKVMKNI